MRLCLDGRVVEAAAAGLDPEHPETGLIEGVDELIALKAGRARRFDGLETRLRAGANALKLEWSMPATQLQGWIARLAEENALFDGAARIVFGRTPDQKPRLIIATVPRPEVSVVCAAIAADVVRTTPSLTYSPLMGPERSKAAAVLAKFDAEGAIVLNAAGRVAGTTTGDVFVLRGGALVTPPASEYPTNSLTRSEVIRLARAEEAPVSLDDLRAATEIAVADGVGLHPVIELDGAPVNGGELGLITSLIAARI